MSRAGRDKNDIETSGKGEYPGKHTNLKSGPVVDVKTIGWEPTCNHDDDCEQSIVLDPFAGAATTGLVANRLKRDFIGIELNPDYVKLGQNRITEDNVS